MGEDLAPTLPLYAVTSREGRRPDEFSQANFDFAWRQSRQSLKSRYANLLADLRQQANIYSTKMPRYLPPSAFVAICIFSLSDAFVPANKITPAEPPVGAQCTLARGSSRSSTTTTALNAKKKKKTAPAASSKIQVKMLKHVEGTGHVRTCICFRHIMRHFFAKIATLFFSHHLYMYFNALH